MYISKDDFEAWMERIMYRFDKQDKTLDKMSKHRNMLDGELLLDNQDLCFLLKVSNRTLQRYRDEGKLPYFRVKAKIYYRASEIRVFIKEHASVNKVNLFEKVTAEEKLSPFSP